MKKVVALILFFVLICTFALAEENTTKEIFTLRNGITFQDTLSTVKSKETLALSGEGQNALQYHGTVANEECGVIFLFDDKKNTLTDMIYGFQNVPSYTKTYRALYDGLTEKYGNSLCLEFGKTYEIMGKAWDYALQFYDAWKIFPNTNTDITNYNEWVVPAANGLVKIDLVQITSLRKDDASTGLNAIFLSYYFVDDDFLEYLNIQKENIQNDL